jgi:hypothetical protein
MYPSNFAAAAAKGFGGVRLLLILIPYGDWMVVVS